MKTIRFTVVVKKCGTPEIYLAWIDPKRDQVLKRALTENRVMTLHQELHGGKKDFGTVGYLKDRHAQILLFPKSLRRFAERRVIAVDYSLLTKGGTVSGAAAPEKKPVTARPISKEPTIERKAPMPPKWATDKNPRPSPVKKMSSSKNPVHPKPADSAMRKIRDEVRRAVAELAAGKSVPAYERLKRLLAKN